jgi:hypothetical protein
VANKHVLDSTITNLGGLFSLGLDSTSFTPCAQIFRKCRVHPTKMYISSGEYTINFNHHQSIMQCSHFEGFLASLVSNCHGKQGWIESLMPYPCWLNLRTPIQPNDSVVVYLSPCIQTYVQLPIIAVAAFL